MSVAVKRPYEQRAAGDGYRVLVDRLRPRGLASGDAEFDEWVKTVAPSTALRQWFGHDPAKFADFRGRYLAELSEAGDDLDRLRGRAKRGRLTLLTATKDPTVSHAAVLAVLLGTRSRS